MNADHAPNAMNADHAMNAMSAINAMNSINLGATGVMSSAVERLSSLPFAQLGTLRPPTRLPYTLPDALPDGTRDITTKEKDYLTAVALKTATTRSGVAVSPYNWADGTGGQSPNIGVLNQCEPGYKSTTDLASQGTVENGILPNRSVAQRYQQTCAWTQDWGLPVLAAQPAAGGCSVLPIGTAPGQNVMGINLGDSTARRCPSFITCEPGKACCIGRFAAVSTGPARSRQMAPSGAGATTATAHWATAARPVGRRRRPAGGRLRQRTA